ncbi:hypothetical protein LIER_19698 [Lithospermum erythrorhizon]|uniref:RNase H type-1 domain-containing protein n=1 Tax=Lithospermum erythrorhizon TaxID=34254 RepID=A0AAV3QIV4_LITER
MEIYVDDMLVKCKKQKEHLENLEETLMKLKESGEHRACKRGGENPEAHILCKPRSPWPEGNYPLIDKFLLALVTSTRKLKDYFENHPIAVVMEQPLKRILANPAQTGRLTKWAIELSVFEITFIPKTGIKAQALADFAIECTARDLPEDWEYVPTLPERPLWTLYVDGASNPKGAGVGILIQGPEESFFEYALRFLFQATNNEAEY